MSHKTSVCMAVYNGEIFLRQQLESIYLQSTKIDELIIVDDCSKDNSEQIINQFKDKLPIKYYKNKNNVGVVKAFEKALKYSTGEIIILCDQDDIWEIEKVDVIKENLKSKGDLCISNFRVIDSSSAFSGAESNFTSTNFSIASTFYKNSFIGCCIAFERKLLDYVLPFPNRIPMHDSWIGINALWFCKVILIEKPLIQYRRHDKNVTGNGGRLIKKISDRFFLFVSFLFNICSGYKFKCKKSKC